MKTIKVERPTLYYLCVVPLNYVLLCSRLLEDKESIKSLTDLSLAIVMACVHRHEDNQRNEYYGFTPAEKKIIQSLARLAYKSFLSKDLIFTKNHLKNYEINVEDPTLYNLMEIHCTDASTKSEDICASFIHLSIQEFLSAVHVCLTWNKKDVKKLATVDPNSRRLDNVQLYTAGLLGDTVNGHKFLKALDEGSGGMEQLYQEHAIEYVTSIKASKGKLSSLTKLQMIRCANEGRMPEMVEEVAKAVVEVTENEHIAKDTTDKVNMLELRQIAGGLLPHHLASIGYFIQESGLVDGLL